jgi:hypothetical protein
MSDILANMFVDTQGGETSQNSQFYGRSEFGLDDYSLNYSVTQSQAPSQQANRMPYNQPNHLERIEEEENMNFNQTQGDAMFGNEEKEEGIMNKINKLSQEIEEIYEETQQSTSKNKLNKNGDEMRKPAIKSLQNNAKSIGFSNPSNVNFFHQGNQSFMPATNAPNSSCSSEPPISKQFHTNKQVGQNLTPTNLPKLPFGQVGAGIGNGVNYESSKHIPNNKNKTNMKSFNIDNTSPQSVRSNTNFDHQSSILNNEFRAKTQEIRNAGLNVMEGLKSSFCSFIENYKIKFIKDTEIIENVLNLDAENIISNEERNKIIDQRMDILFKDLFSILSEFQRK